MRGRKRHKWFGIVLVAVLLFQLTYQTIHIFTNHLFENHIEGVHAEEANLSSKIHESNHTCDLCAKLLGKTLFLWTISLISFSLIIFGLLLICETNIYDSTKNYILSLRGPPYPTF